MPTMRNKRQRHPQKARLSNFRGKHTGSRDRALVIYPDSEVTI